MCAEHTPTVSLIYPMKAVIDAFLESHSRSRLYMFQVGELTHSSNLCTKLHVNIVQYTMPLIF
jgi:hypothetical protein